MIFTRDHLFWFDRDSHHLDMTIKMRQDTTRTGVETRYDLIPPYVIKRWLKAFSGDTKAKAMRAYREHQDMCKNIN